MSSERPLPSNRRLRPRGVPLLPPDIGEQAAAPAPSRKARGKAARPAEQGPAPEGAVSTDGAAPPSKPKKPFRLPTIPNPFKGRGAAMMTVGRFLLGAALFFAIAGASSFGLYRYVSSSSRFAIKNVLIEGAAHRSQPEVARLAGVALGQNIFSVDLEASRRGLVADPWIERATIDRRLPGTISIQVIEREPLSLVALGGSLYLSSRGGEIFKRVEAGDPVDLPLITGLGGEGELLRDREGLTSSVRRAHDLLTDYNRLGPRAYPLQEVNIATDGSFSLIVGRDGVRLMLGKAPYRLKLERAARVLAESERRRGQPSVIFLDNEAHPERVVARMK